MREDIEDLFGDLLLCLFGEELVHIVDDLLLVPDPGDDVRLIERRRLVGIGLDHTAAEDDAGVGGHAAEFPDGLAGLLVGDRRDGAGVDDVDVGTFRLLGQEEPCPAKPFRQRLRVVFVHFTAERMEIDLHVLTAFPGLEIALL